MDLNVDPAEIYTYYDQAGDISASARRRIISPLAHGIDVYDGNGELIGSLEKVLIKNPLSPYSVYIISDKDGNKLATSKKIDFLGTGVSIYDNDGERIAKITRSAWDRGRADWDIKFDEIGKVDARLIAFIASFKTTADLEKEAEAKKSEDK